MPKGFPNTPKQPAEAGATAPLERAVRSREQLDAEKYTADFLRDNRIDFASFEQKLTYFGEHPGWVRRWPLDQGSRIQNLLGKGWRLVTREEVGMSDSVGRGNTDIGDRVSVVTTAGDGPVRHILMEIPQKLYDMYAEARTAPARATEEAIRRGSFKVDDSEHTYNPGEMQGSAFYGTHNKIESKPA